MIDRVPCPGCNEPLTISVGEAVQCKCGTTTELASSLNGATNLHYGRLVTGRFVVTSAGNLLSDPAYVEYVREKKNGKFVTVVPLEDVPDDTPDETPVVDEEASRKKKEPVAP